MHETSRVGWRSSRVRVDVITGIAGPRRSSVLATNNVLPIRPGFLLAIACSLITLGCNACNASTTTSRPVNLPPLPPGTKVDTSSPYFKYWPRGRPALFEVRSNLVLAVPAQYQPFWHPDLKLVRAPAPISAIPKNQRGSVAFQFFLPDFTGYTPENYTEKFAPNRVDVIELQPADPRQIVRGAPGEYPPNMLARALKSLLDPSTAISMYGLTCYKFSRDSPETHNMVSCWGRDKQAGGNYVMFDVPLRPFRSWMKFPTMQARYFTPMYGGLRIVWRTNAKNLPNWQVIDAAIWRFIKEWNLIPKETNNTGSR